MWLEENPQAFLMKPRVSIKHSTKGVHLLHLLFCSRKKSIKQALFLLWALPPPPGLPCPRDQTWTPDSPLNSCLLAVGWKRWS